jgi:serpin B
MRKTFTYVWILTLLIAVTGCTALPTAQPAGPVDPQVTQAPQDQDVSLVQSNEQRAESPRVAAQDLTDQVQGNNAFAMDLYRQLGQGGSDNLFYSPYSISLALAMTYAGARGQTADEMAAALHFNLPQETLHPAFNALDQQLAAMADDLGNAEEGQPFTLNIANALWGQQGLNFEEDFLDTLARNYGAGMRLMDFAAEPEAARQEINQWVSDQTMEKIKDLLAEGTIDPTTRLVLTNAIYFNAGWFTPFNEGATQDETFTLLDGSEVTVPMMHTSGRFSYADGDGWRAVELPYVGQRAAMLVIVPEREQFEAFEESLDAAKLDEIVNNLESAGVQLGLPKFTYESEFSLVETLEALGMEQAFGGGADFSRMTGDASLYISEIVHKAFVDVNEKGTEAAAATAVVMAESALMENQQLTVDSPFIYLIRDRETGTLLFVGRVLNPVE